MTFAIDLQPGPNHSSAIRCHPRIGWKSCNLLAARRISTEVNTGLFHNLVDLYGLLTNREMARMQRLIGGPVRRIHTLRDCPEYEIHFRPFLLTDPNDPEFLFRPGKCDAGPMAKAIHQALLSID
jgi:hypothetical protein